jgi:hypothetical protein
MDYGFGMDTIAASSKPHGSLKASSSLSARALRLIRANVFLVVYRQPDSARLVVCGVMVIGNLDDAILGFVFFLVQRDGVDWLILVMCVVFRHGRTPKEDVEDDRKLTWRQVSTSAFK